MRYSKHLEKTSFIHASASDVFDFIDDHAKFSSQKSSGLSSVS